MNSLLLCMNLCLAYTRPNNWLFCRECHKVISNIKQIAKKYDQRIIINDKHTPEDPEFAILPPHMVNQVDRHPVCNYQEDLGPSEVLTKTKLNAFQHENNRMLIASKVCDIHICGFNLSTDIVPTCLGLIDLNRNISVLQNCCGDISENMKKEALNYLKLFNIRTI